MTTDLKSELENKRITREILFAAFIGPPNESDDPRILEKLVEAVYVKTVRVGEVIYREGEPSDDVLFMNEGRIRLSRPGAVDWVYEGRWVIGSADAFLERPRNRTAVAETEIRLFGLASRRWFEANQNKPEALLAALIGYGGGIGRMRVELAPTGGFEAAQAAAPIEGARTLAGRVRLIANLPYFKGVSAQVIVDLARAAKVEELESDAPLPVPPPERLFIVTRGKIELRHAEPEIVAQFGPSDLVGGSIHLNEENAAWHGRALERSEVVSIEVCDLCDLLEENLQDMKTISGTAALERERLCDLLADRRGELILR
jgi:CRP-like cAMP-binding protein